MKKTKSKVIFITTKILFILFIISSLNVSAQKTYYEFSIIGGGGFSFLNIQPKILNASSSGFSGDIGISYTIFPIEQFGIHLGAGFGISEINCKVPKEWDIEIDGAKFTRYNYSEYVKMPSLNIPFMLQYQNIQKSDRQKSMFYAMGGVRINVILNSQFETKFNVSNITKQQKHEGKISNAFLNSFTFETGFKHYISNNLILYTGAYFDYGLNNFIEEYRHPPEIFTKELLLFSDKSNLITIGIKLRLVLSFHLIRHDAIYACPAMRRR